MLPRIILKKGKEKPILRGHPWVFSGAVNRWEGDVSPGALGELRANDGQFLGIGHINPHSQIVFRLLTREKEAVSMRAASWEQTAKPTYTGSRSTTAVEPAG